MSSPQSCEVAIVYALNLVPYKDQIRAAIEIYHELRSKFERVGRCIAHIFDDLQLADLINVIRNITITHIITIGISVYLSPLPAMIAQEEATPILELSGQSIPMLTSQVSNHFFEPFAHQDHKTKFIIQELATRGLKKVTIIVCEELAAQMVTPSLFPVSKEIFGEENVNVIYLFQDVEHFRQDVINGSQYWKSPNLTAKEVNSQGLFLFMGGSSEYNTDICKWIRQHGIDFEIVVSFDTALVEFIDTDACDFMVIIDDLFMNVKKDYNFEDPPGFPFHPTHGDNRTSIQILAEMMRFKVGNSVASVAPRVAAMLHVIETSLNLFKNGECNDFATCLRRTKTPTLAGYIHFGDETEQRNIHRNIFHAQYRFNYDQGKYIERIVYPSNHASHTLTFPIPPWNDRDCFDAGCPECYYNVCEMISELMLWLIGIFFIITFLGSAILHIFSNGEFSDFFGDIAYVAYAILEIISGIVTIVSIYALRESANKRSSAMTAIIITWCGADVTGAVFKIAVFTIEKLCESKLDEFCKWNFQIILLLVNASGILILLRDLSRSANQTKSQVPIIIDLILNVGEISLVLFGKTLEEKLDVVGTVLDSIALSMRSERQNTSLAEISEEPATESDSRNSSQSFVQPLE